MENIDFNCFMTVIQLMCGVNFAYISFSFHRRLFKLIFSEKVFIKTKFADEERRMVADITSLQEMSKNPITSAETGKSNFETISLLLKDYQILLDQWHSAKDEINKNIEAIKNTKCIKSLFLYISLYGILALIALPLSTYLPLQYPYFIFNIFFLIGCVFYTICIFRKQGPQGHKHNVFLDLFEGKCSSLTPDDVIYRKTVLAFVYLLILCFCLYVFDIKVLGRIDSVELYGYGLPNWIRLFNGLATLLLPFYPCLLCYIFVSKKIKKLKSQTEIITNKILERWRVLTTEKCTQDKLYEIFGEATQEIPWS